MWYLNWNGFVVKNWIDVGTKCMSLLNKSFSVNRRLHHTTNYLVESHQRRRRQDAGSDCIYQSVYIIVQIGHHMIAPKRWRHYVIYNNVLFICDDGIYTLSENFLNLYHFLFTSDSMYTVAHRNLRSIHKREWGATHTRCEDMVRGHFHITAIDSC